MKTNAPRRLLALIVLAVLGVSWGALPALAGGDRHKPKVAVTADCDSVTIVNTGKTPAAIAVRLGDGYLELELAKGTSKTYTGGVAGHGWEVWLDADADGIDAADSIDYGVFEPCSDASTTTTTAPPTPPTTAPPTAGVVTAVLIDCDLIVTNTGDVSVDVTFVNGDGLRVDNLTPAAVIRYTPDHRFGWGVLVDDELVAGGDPGSVPECIPAATDPTTTTTTAGDVEDPTTTTQPDTEEETPPTTNNPTTTVPATTTGTLPFTGSDDIAKAIAGAVALLAGAAILTIARRHEGATK